MPFVNDTFSSGSGSALTSHTGEVGATWTNFGNGSAGALNVQSGKVRQAQFDSWARNYASGSAASAEYDVQLEVSRPSAAADTNTRVSILGRVNTSTWDWYEAVISDGGSLNGNTGVVDLVKRVSGSFTTLATGANTAPIPSGGAAVTVALQIKNSAKKVFSNGIEILSSTDNTLTAAGKAGLGHALLSGSPTDTNTLLIDNFAASDPGVSLSRTATDAIAISDSVRTTVTRRATDTIAISESVTISPSKGRSASEFVTVAEALGRTHQRSLVVSDAISVSDAADRSITPHFTEGANTGFLLLFAVQAIYQRATAETVAVADAAVASVTRFLALASEADVARSIHPVSGNALGQAAESELAQTIQPLKGRVLGLATGSQGSLAITRAKHAAVVCANATESATTVTPATGQGVPVGRAVGGDAALRITVTKRKALGAAVETCVVPPFARVANTDSLIRVTRYVGEQNVPQDVKRRRRQVYDAMRRFGTPVVVKHMWNDEDVELGLAARSPNFKDPYGQVRVEDPFSYGVGFVGTALSDNEWVSPTGQIVKAALSPGMGYTRAPRYRGFGPGYLTYVILPDAAEDVFKLTPGGALIRTQIATVQAPWYPEINDNDMIVAVELDRQGRVRKAHERFQAKQTSPVSIRGLDRRGRREYSEDGGNRFVVNQVFEMTLIPTTHPLYKVDIDR